MPEWPVFVSFVARRLLLSCVSLNEIFAIRLTIVIQANDWSDISRVDRPKPDAAHTPKRIRSLITLHPVSREGDQRESHIFIGRHRRRRSFHRSTLPATHSRRSSDVMSFGAQGVAGTIDIMASNLIFFTNGSTHKALCRAQRPRVPSGRGSHHCLYQRKLWTKTNLF
jgi:hypothetical protein